MEESISSVIPIQHKMKLKLIPEDGKCVWDDMHGWMEQRQREWDVEMAQLRKEFFSFKSDGPTSRRSSDSSLQDKMSISSKFCDTAQGSKVFCVTFDVSQFDPEEINVRTQGNSLIVHAKHEEQLEKKSISREFNRRIDIPSQINPQTLQCFLREDGVLQVHAELPSSPSYESSSINRDSPYAMENSSVQSTFSDRLSDRDICSPPRTDRDFSPPRLDWAMFSPSRTTRDIYSPPRTDNYRPLRTQMENSTRLDRDIYSSHGSDTDPYSQSSSEYYHRPSTDICSPAGTDREAYSGTYSCRQPDKDAFRHTNADRITDNTVDMGSTLDNIFDLSRSFTNGLRMGERTRNGRESNAVSENGYSGSTDSDVFSVTIDVGTDFEPHELAVKTVDRKLVVQARQGNRNFGNTKSGNLYREFDLPDGVEPESITANLTPEGTLLIEASTGNWPSRNPYPYTT